MQKILSKMRKAIETYEMIEDGDKIAVALSGGKDSITLMYALKNLQIFYPKKFELMAININPGFEGFDTDLLNKVANDAKVELHIAKSDIKEIVFDIRKEKNPCSLCANLRRGMLNSIAKEYGCNKIALGHNEDDVIETFLLNIIYAGKIATISPISYMDRSNMSLIRPLVYTKEKDIKSFIKRAGIETMPKLCPMDGSSKREYALELLKGFEKQYKFSRSNIIGAIKRSNIIGWKE